MRFGALPAVSRTNLLDLLSAFFSLVCALVQFEAARVEEAEADAAAEFNISVSRRGAPPYLAAVMDVVLPLLPRFQRSAAAALQPTTDMFFRELVLGALFAELSQLSPNEIHANGCSTLLAASRLTRSLLTLMDCFSKVRITESFVSFVFPYEIAIYCTRLSIMLYG